MSREDFDPDFIKSLEDLVRNLREKEQIEKERRDAEEALKKSEEKYRLLADNVADVIWMIDTDWNITYMSPSIQTMRGFTVEERLALHIDKVMTPDSIKNITDIINAEYKKEITGAADPDRIVSIELQEHNKDGSTGWTKANMRFIRDSDGKLTEVLGISRDITEQKKAEEALKLSEEMFSKAFHSGGALRSISTLLGGVYLDVNKNFGEVTGYTREEAISNSSTDLGIVSQEDRDKFKAKLEEKGSVYNMLLKLYKKNGDSWYGEYSAEAVDVMGEKLLISSVQDVTERVKVQEALQDSEQRLQAALEAGQIGAWTWDMRSGEGTNIVINEYWAEMIGKDPKTFRNEENEELEVDMMDWLDIVHPDDKKKWMKTLYATNNESSKTDILEVNHNEFEVVYRIRFGDGDDNYRWVVNKGEVIERDEFGYATIMTGTQVDITEKRQLEEEQQRAATLESIGVLAGGLAHDFNNFLAGILGNLTLTKMGLGKTSPAENCLQDIYNVSEGFLGGKMNINPEEIIKTIHDTIKSHKNKIDGSEDVFELLEDAEIACQRATGLTKQLLTFAKGGAPIKDTISIDNVMKEATKFALSGSNIKSQVNIAKDLYLVEADATQMNQVFNNLTINAIQAMPSGGGIEIYGKNITVTERDNITLSPGKYVHLAFKDAGVGISPDSLSKIFEPYFSTKGTGSGLGLATTYSIITKHGGLIKVESEIDQGTTFNIYLPASEKADLEKTVETGTLSIGGARILIMDDEHIVSKPLRMMLEEMGCEADVTIDGEEAIQRYREAQESGNPYDAVFLDLTIPGGMGGQKTIEKLIEIDPAVKAIVYSGYSDNHIMSNFSEYGFKGRMEKPFLPEQINKALHNVLKG